MHLDSYFSSCVHLNSSYFILSAAFVSAITSSHCTNQLLICSPKALLPPANLQLICVGSFCAVTFDVIVIILYTTHSALLPLVLMQLIYGLFIFVVVALSRHLDYIHL